MAIWIPSTSLAPFSLVLTQCYSKLSGSVCFPREAAVCLGNWKDMFAIHVNDLHLALKGGNVSQTELSSKVTRILANSA